MQRKEKQLQFATCNMHWQQACTPDEKEREEKGRGEEGKKGKKGGRGETLSSAAARGGNITQGSCANTCYLLKTLRKKLQINASPLQFNQNSTKSKDFFWNTTATCIGNMLADLQV